MPMMRTRARMQIVASDRAGRGNVPEHIHFTERPKKPFAAGLVGVHVGSSYIKRPRQCPVRDTAWVSRGSMDMKIGISL